MVSRESDASKYRHAGRWVLLDARFHLLAIDSATYPGTSPKNSLDLVVRRILLPRMRTASVNKQPLTEVVDDHRQSWAVQIEPLLGPQTGELVALLGCYWPANATVPAMPLVGSWEWHITPPGPHLQMRAYWSDSLYAVYDMTVPDGAGPHGWEGARWLDDVVVEADRAETRRFQEGLCRAPSDALRFHTLRIRSPQTGTVSRIRLAGRRDVTAPGPDIWVRGVSLRNSDRTPGERPLSGPVSYLEAWFALAPDPLCAIDTTYEQLFLTSALFATLDVALPAHRHLPQMCHPDDLPALRAMLTHATAEPNTPVGPIPVRFSSDSGGWTTLELTGVGVWSSVERAHHVLCRATTGEDRGGTP